MKTQKQKDFIINFAYYALIIGLVFIFLRYAFKYCWPLIVGWILASIAYAINKKINKSKKFNKITSYIVLVTLFILLTALSFFTVTITLRFIINFNYTGFYESNIAPALENVKKVINNYITSLGMDFGSTWNDVVNNGIAEFANLLKTIITGVGTLLSKTPNLLIEVVMLIISSIYFLADYDNVMDWFKKVLPARINTIFAHTKEFAIGILAKCIKAYILIMMITFVELFIGLTILKEKNVAIISLATTICDILPVLGVGTVLIPWSIVLILLGDVGKGIGMLILYSIITLIRNYIEPKLVGEQINLHPLISLTAIFIGIKIMGLAGALLVPLLTALLKYLYGKGDFKEQD